MYEYVIHVRAYSTYAPLWLLYFGSLSLQCRAQALEFLLEVDLLVAASLRVGRRVVALLAVGTG